MLEKLPKVYEPKKLEEQAYQLWSTGNAFHAEPSNPAPAYTIVIPPPNVTAPLHLGHALNNTLQDILIRFRRMQGCNTLWMPGTDHAGIATQTVVEKRILAEEGKRRTDFARQEFVKRVQAWKDEYEARIIQQLKLMGCSCDWQRTRFTMDEVCARAVRTAFYKLFQDGLIYRGKRLVNWDPATQTVLADDEVEHQTIQGNFWYMRYPLAAAVECDGKKIEYVTVATTRPETMLGDTAVAMNPADRRAGGLIGKKVILPLVGRLIPIIADEHVVLPDPDSGDEKARFSTGFLKVTPAHDPDDWAIGQRHSLAVVNVMGPDGTISDKFGWEDAKGTEAEQFLGMDRFEAREAIVEWFRQENLLEDVRPYSHEVGHSYRSHVPIEPYLSDQWYIAVKKPIEHLTEKVGQGLIAGTDVPVNSLAGLALKPLLDGRLRFIPERYARTYQSWLENLRDWPISRQLWWGHQIPVWHIAVEELTDERTQKLDCKLNEWREQGRVETTGRGAAGDQEDLLTGGEPLRFVCVRDPDGSDRGIVEYIEKAGYARDADVLDTWFSSALWPFSTLGWPAETAEMKKYYPGSVLCTAREIITLWVSRMVMMGQYCAGDIPFSDVFIHAMIQDGEGRKMSKSLGNGIDPLDIIDSHGADAMRLVLASMTTQTQDVRMPVEPTALFDGRTVNTSPKFDLGRNFCNKLWNASRFALVNLAEEAKGDFEPSNITFEDRWILSRLAATIDTVTTQLEEYKFSEPVGVLYRFFWNEVCDWYLELIKPRMRQQEQQLTAQRILAFVLDAALRMLHPFTPFITEGIYQQLRQVCPNRDLNGLGQLGPAQELITAAWPSRMAQLVDEEVDRQMNLVQTAIRLIRDIRSRCQIEPRKTVAVVIKCSPQTAKLLKEQGHLISHLSKVGEFAACEECEKPANAAAAITEEMEVYVAQAVEAAAERERLTKQKEQLIQGIAGAQGKLSNEQFVQRAKPEVVQRERQRLGQLQEQLATVLKNLEDLPN